jgi:hypothetical protein
LSTHCLVGDGQRRQSSQSVQLTAVTEKFSSCLLGSSSSSQVDREDRSQIVDRKWNNVYPNDDDIILTNEPNDFDCEDDDVES